MQGNLDTTNIFLGMIAVVSVLEALLLIGIGVAAFMVYRRTMAVINGIEERQVAPAMTRVNAILDDVKGVSARIKEETERVDQAIHTTMDRVDDTVDRVRTNVRVKTSRLVDLVRGARVALESILHNHREQGGSRAA
jgi:hypothetical protein